MICSLCSRETTENTGHRPSWSWKVCQWCYDEFSRNGARHGEEAFNKYISLEMAKLAKRAADGQSIYRCEAMCTQLFRSGSVERIEEPHRCTRFAKVEIGGHRVCGRHAMRRVTPAEFAPRSRRRFLVAADSAAEFAAGVRSAVPPEWLNLISAELADSRFGEPENTPQEEA